MIERLSNEDFCEIVLGTQDEVSGRRLLPSHPVSNEVCFQNAIPEALSLMGGPGNGAFIGVGHEQGFSYIAAFRPEVALLLDLRRHVWLWHLAAKVLFETCATRAAFLSRMFSRQRPDGLDERSTAKQLLDAYRGVPPDPGMCTETLAMVVAFLNARGLDLAVLLDEWTVLQEFLEWGVGIKHNDFSDHPGFYEVCTSQDEFGRSWHFLADEAAFLRVKSMHEANLVIPICGKLHGPTALQEIGRWLQERSVEVKALYISNQRKYVAGARYRPQDIPQFEANIAGLPWAKEHAFVAVSAMRKLELWETSAIVARVDEIMPEHGALLRHDTVLDLKSRIDQLRLVERREAS